MKLNFILRHCINRQRYFTLASLNELIEGMELGYMETDRPVPISAKTLNGSESNALKQKGI